MIIANPIYDVVFKRLMQNTRIARFFIETLTGESLEVLELKPQEFVYKEEQRVLAVLRYDFIATIKTLDGEHKKVLIEIQKAKNPIDLIRFRNYLGEQYKNEDDIQTIYGPGKQPLPIIAIYLLGFNLQDIDAAAIKVARNYTDMLTHKIITKKSDFIERLSHDCYVVQMSKIQTKVQTSLEELLSVFEQTNFVDAKGIIKEYKFEITNEIIKSMLEMLHYVGTDPVRKKEIEIEQEAWRTIAAMGGDRNRELEMQIEQKERTIQQKERTIEQKERLIEDKERTIEDKERTIEDKERTIEDKERTIEDKERTIEDKEKALQMEKKVNEDLAAQLAELKRQIGLNK